jgi:hypothetical protein
VCGRYVRFVLAVIFFLDGGWPLFKFQKKFLDTYQQPAVKLFLLRWPFGWGGFYLSR